MPMPVMRGLSVCFLAATFLRAWMQTGGVPASLCRFNESSALTDILLANNELTGELQVPNCETLVLLDVSVSSAMGPGCGVPTGLTST